MIVANRVDVATSEWLDQYQVPYSRAIESTWLRDLLSWILPAVIFFGLWFFLIRRFAERAGGGIGGFMSIGKSRAKIYVEQNTGVTFADVAGVDEAKAELQEIIAFLKDPQGYGRLGARMPKGVLLVGPPGTGKTLLAKAVAGEAAVPFFSISGSEFVEMFVGVGAARVRDLFEQARAKAPAIIFIDELDALGRARGAGGMVGGHDEREQTLQQLLVELTASTAPPAWCCWPPPTGPRSSTRRCCVPAASTARCWSTGPTSPGGCRSCRCMSRRSGWHPRST